VGLKRVASRTYPARSARRDRRWVSIAFIPSRTWVRDEQQRVEFGRGREGVDQGMERVEVEWGREGRGEM